MCQANNITINSAGRGRSAAIDTLKRQKKYVQDGGLILATYSSDNGVMSDKTKDSMVELLAALCKEYKLTTADIVLHADVTGIACPKYYVDNNEEWQNVLKEVSAKLKQ